MLARLKSVDSYGERIGVNYRGSESYQTYIGAILTIIATIFVLIYAAANGEVLVLR